MEFDRDQYPNRWPNGRLSTVVMYLCEILSWVAPVLLLGFATFVVAVGSDFWLNPSPVGGFENWFPVFFFPSAGLGSFLLVARVSKR